VRVSVIITTRNEAQAIGRVIGDLPADLVTEVIVVDSNQTGRLRSLHVWAQESCPSRAAPRRGYGQACLTGLTCTSARSLGLSVHLTDPFYDVDVAADLSQLANELQRRPGKAPRTAKWLSEWASAGAKNGFL
jgi:glycosyltransferase involved in cell wall biosynthesis